MRLQAPCHPIDRYPEDVGQIPKLLSAPRLSYRTCSKGTDKARFDAFAAYLFVLDKGDLVEKEAENGDTGETVLKCHCTTGHASRKGQVRGYRRIK
jgi:hypothetical protein